VYLPRLLRFVATQTEESPHLEFCLLWIRATFDAHGQWITDNRGALEAELRTVSRAVAKIRDDLRRLADENDYTLDYLLSQPVADERSLVKVNGDEVVSEDDEMVEAAGDDGSEAEWIGLE
jgi:periodic tryptophan protein 2